MFEKEAEEYVIKKHHIDKTKLPIDFSLSCEFSDDFTDFQNGAEFGYNKCNTKLTKAKEIIHDLIDSLEVIDREQTRELKVAKEAEQFLINIERYENGK